MKKLIAIFCLLSSTLVLKAQTFDFGVKAGLNRGTLSSSIPKIETSGATGFVAGTYGRVGIFGFFAQPEIVFSQRKGAFKSDTNGTAIINTLSYIDIPVLFGYKLLFARVNLGPNFQFLTSAKQVADDLNKDPNFSRSNFNASNIGYQVGVGVDLLKLSLDIRYDGSFGSLGKKITTASGNTIDYSTRSSMWQFTVGFKIY